MQRADRLLQLVMLLRARGTTTAAVLAEDLGISVRTVYRYVRELEDAGVPIEGEAGVGYRLGRGFEVPPMRLGADELEALALGLRMVEQQGDAELALAARMVWARLEGALPPPMRAELNRAALFAPRVFVREDHALNLGLVRRAVATRRLLHCGYTDARGRRTERTLRTVGAYCWSGSWTVGAWCETRQAYRNFRPDRMIEPTLGERWSAEPEVTVEAFLAAAMAKGLPLDRSDRR